MMLKGHKGFQGRGLLKLIRAIRDHLGHAGCFEETHVELWRASVSATSEFHLKASDHKAIGPKEYVSMGQYQHNVDVISRYIILHPCQACRTPILAVVEAPTVTKRKLSQPTKYRTDLTWLKSVSFPRGSKYPMFKASGSKKNTLRGFCDQTP